MRALIHVVVAALPLFAQAPDHYPRVRELLLEAEKASLGKVRLKDGGDPHLWIGDTLARAGYTEDAERVYRKSPHGKGAPLGLLILAWAVYGQQARAEKAIESLTIPATKAAYLESYANVLWRMGKPEEARKRYEEARTIARSLADPAKRKSLLPTIEQGLQFVSDPPPISLSATPRPNPRPVQQESSIPLFPITPSGLRDSNQALPKDASEANGELMTRIYERAIAGDPGGVEQLLEKATTPFQRAFGLASIEHVFIQLEKPEVAEKYANRIPEDDSESKLAKAEALNSAAAAWLRAGRSSVAQAAFDAAKRIALTAADAPFSQLSVLLAVAASERKAGHLEESTATLRLALEGAKKFLPTPTPPAGQVNRSKPGAHFKGEALRLILRGAIGARNAPVIEETVKAWPFSGNGPGSVIAQAWLDEGDAEQAIAAAQSIENPDARVTSLLLIAGRLLQDAGAPTF